MSEASSSTTPTTPPVVPDVALLAQGHPSVLPEARVPQWPVLPRHQDPWLQPPFGLPTGYLSHAPTPYFPPPFGLPTGYLSHAPTPYFPPNPMVYAPFGMPYPPAYPMPLMPATSSQPQQQAAVGNVQQQVAGNGGDGPVNVAGFTIDLRGLSEAEVQRTYSHLMRQVDARVDTAQRELFQALDARAAITNHFRNRIRSPMTLDTQSASTRESASQTIVEEENSSSLVDNRLPESGGHDGMHVERPQQEHPHNIASQSVLTQDSALQISNDPESEPLDNAVHIKRSPPESATLENEPFEDNSADEYVSQLGLSLKHHNSDDNGSPSDSQERIPAARVAKLSPGEEIRDENIAQTGDQPQDKHTLALLNAFGLSFGLGSSTSGVSMETSRSPIDEETRDGLPILENGEVDYSYEMPSSSLGEGTSTGRAARRESKTPSASRGRRTPKNVLKDRQGRFTKKTSEEINAQTHEKSQPKRGRGRPPKYSKENLPPAEQVSTSTKKRLAKSGRRRRASDSQSTSTARSATPNNGSGSLELEEEALDRRRGATKRRRVSADKDDSKKERSKKEKSTMDDSDDSDSEDCDTRPRDKKTKKTVPKEKKSNKKNKK